MRWMFFRKWSWTILGILALLVRGLASHFPDKTEAIYSRGIFPGIRKVIDVSVSRLPFPSFYLFLGAVLLVFGYFLFRWKKKKGWKKKTGYTLRSASNFLGITVFFFLLLWGYNYQRVPVAEQLSLQILPLDEETLAAEILYTQEALARIRGEITSDTLPIESPVSYSFMEDFARSEVKENLNQLGFDTRGFPRTKEFFPAGFLRKMGILGIYFPFTGEGYIDPSLHPLEKPFTLAHEMAHSFGITHEGEANFVAWLVGDNSDNPLFRYSAQLKLFRYQLRDLFISDRNAYQKILEDLDPGIKNDLESIHRHSRRIRPISDRLSRLSNDVFLKTQGVGKGIQSYAELPMLVYAWESR